VSGYVWVDTGYESLKRGNTVDANQKTVLSEGRGLLRFTPTYSSGKLLRPGTGGAGREPKSSRCRSSPRSSTWTTSGFVQGRWKSWDVQLGRFEAFEVYHFGMGLDINTLERNGATGDQDAVSTRRVRARRERQYRVPPERRPNLAIHAYPTDFLRVEMLGQLGLDQAATFDTVGARPAVVFGCRLAEDQGGGATCESSSRRARRPRRAYSSEAAPAPFSSWPTPTWKAASTSPYGLVDYYAATNSTDPNASRGDFDTARSVKDLDTGGFANVRVIDGLSRRRRRQLRPGDGSASRVVHPPADVRARSSNLLLKQLYIKVVGAYAKGHLAPGNTAAWNNTMTSARLRLTFLF